MSEPMPSQPAVSASEAEGFITIGPNPKLLRNDDADVPLRAFPHVPANQFEGFRHEGAIVRAASHIGTRHLNSLGPRQDAYALGRSRDGNYLILAIADGVGSADLSASGAEWATRVAVGRIAQGLDRGQSVSPEVVAKTVSEWVLKVGTMLFGKASSAESLATTLVVAVVDVREFHCELFRVGDSEAFVWTPDRWLPLFAGSGLEDPTDALPSTDPKIETACAVLDPGTCLLIVTDGIGDPLNHAADVGSHFHAALATPPTHQGFSSLVGFQKQQAHDDQTAVAVWRAD